MGQKQQLKENLFGALSWMRSSVRFLEMADRDVRVDLRRVDGFVAQKLLDVAEIGSRFEHMRGASVPQGMRRDLVLDSDAQGGSSDDIDYGLPV